MTKTLVGIALAVVLGAGLLTACDDTVCTDDAVMVAVTKKPRTGTRPTLSSPTKSPKSSTAKPTSSKSAHRRHHHDDVDCD